MTAVYRNADVKFFYPENWTLWENEEGTDFFEVSVESPQGGVWSVCIFNDRKPLPELIETIAASLRDQYQDFESTDFRGQIGELHAVGFDSDFYCLNFLITAYARAFTYQGRNMAVYCQAESRQFTELQAVFEAITLSLVKKIEQSEI